MSRGKQMQHSEEVRGKIIGIAHRIVADEGVDALSIRRITKEMGYSPGIVYHYFENKEQLLSCVLGEGYARILGAIQPLQDPMAPDEAIRLGFIRYVQSGLSNGAEYRALMFSTSPQVLSFTSVLGEGRHGAGPALGLLQKALEEGVEQGMFAPCDAALTAQVLWSTMFGLLARLIIEQDVSPAQQERLMNREIDIILKGLRP